MYILYVYIICIHYMYTLYVYIICIYYMYILYVYINICITEYPLLASLGIHPSSHPQVGGELPRREPRYVTWACCGMLLRKTMGSK